MNKKYSWITTSAALLTLLGARDVAAAPLSECYVDATIGIGFDSPTCGTAAAPCRTLRHAVNNRVVPGATVYLVGAAPHIAGGITLTTSLNIHGLGAGSTILGALGMDRHIVINAQGETVRIDGITFIDGEGTTLADGGSIYVERGTLEVAYSEFENNVARNGGAIACGARCEGLKVIETDFRFNSATDFGGAIYSTSSTTIKRCAFEIGTGSWGGAIAQRGGDLFVIDTQFYQNSVSGWGGAIFGDDTDTEVRRSSFVANAASSGAAMYQYEGLLLANSTFAENTATTTAAIVGSGTLWNVTLVNNMAATDHAQDLLGDFHVEDSIITHPNRGSGEPECSGTTTGERYLTDSTTCGGAPGRLGAHNNAALGSLDYHGGPTLVYELFSTSNAVGVPGSCRLAQDQRDMSRPATECDLGAFELQ